jgi:hypothetical protein
MKNQHSVKYFDKSQKMRKIIGKMRREILFVFALVIPIGILTSFYKPLDTPAEYSLENSFTRITIRDNCIVSLFDKVRKVEHVSPQTASAPGLLNIHLVKGITPASEIDASKMVSKVISKKADELELEFSHQEASAKVKISLSSSDAEIIWSISVHPSDKDLMVGSVAFPVFSTPVLSEGIEKNCLLPLYEGRLHPITEVIIGHKPKVYPGCIFAQMIACLGQKGGFMLWTSDNKPNVKEFNCKSGKTDALFSVIHRMPYQSGEWKSGYDTRISLCDPRWYDAADIYRNWASQQYWCATKFKDRKDIPAIIHNPSYHCNVQIGKMSDTDLAELPQKMSDWSAQLKVPVYVRGTFWEKRGGWVGIDYFPPKLGEEKMKILSSDLKSRNIPFICEITGYAWQTGKSGTITRNINKMSQEQLNDLKLYFNENNGPDLCEQNANGEQSDAIIRLCRGSSLGTHFIQDMNSKLFDLGTTAYHHDSDPGTMPDGISGCFNAAHGHPIPCGPWSTEITRKAFRDVRAEAARRGINNFFITKECCTEQLNMEIQGYISRLSETYKVPFIVPLVQYLYHEYIPVVLYNGQIDELNDIILMGQFPGGRVYPVIPAVLVDYYSSLNVYSGNFLKYGRMLRPLITDIPVDQVKYTVEGSSKEVFISVPHVRQSAWMDDLGNIGVFAINSKTSASTVNVPLPGKGNWQATLFIGEKEQSTRTVSAGEKIEWNLPPDRLAAVIFKPVK